MTAPSPIDPRLLELLADRALEGLSSDEARELDSHLSDAGVDDDLSLDLAAAAAALAFVEPVTEELPAHLRAKLLKSAQQAARQPSAQATTAPSSQPRPQRQAATPAQQPDQQPTLQFGQRPQGFRVVPWLAAAAGIALAVIAWWPQAAAPIDPAQRMAALESRADSLELAWQDWDNPEIPGVKGEVVWCESQQEGYMRFVGLKPNDPAREQYQLWIIDKRGMQKRVSGGVFNVPTSGEVVVPIDPGVQVKDAAAFAVTIEEPGGTPVSDMDRRVVIAAKG